MFRRNDEMSATQTADYLGCSYHTLLISRKDGTLFGMPGPSFNKVGNRIVYSLKELREWKKEYERKNSSNNSS